MEVSARDSTRVLLALILWGTYIYYVIKAGGKLMNKRIGVAFSQEFRSSFRFPTLILCGTHVETEREDQQGYLVVQFGTQTVKGGKEVEQIVWNRTASEEESGWRWEVTSAYSEETKITCDELTAPKEWEMVPGNSYGIYLWINMGSLPADARFVFTMVSSPGESVYLGGSQSEVHVMPLNTLGISGDQEVLTHIGLTFEAREALNQGDKYPCSNSKGHTAAKHEKCLWNYLLVNHNCSSRANEPNMTKCQEDWTIYKEASSLMSQSPYEVYKATGCKLPCRDDRYNLAISKDYVQPKSSLPKNGKNHTHMLHYYLSKPVLTTRTEYWVYDGATFLADIGGMGGMLLGVSLLGCYDLIWKLRSKFCTPKK